jgi:putative transcriptional regulator
MTTTLLKPTKGRLLISVPFLNDFFFGRSVVILTEHNTEGSVGFILNKPLETKVSEAVKELPKFNAPLYLGGPVENQSLFYLHTLGMLVKDSIEVVNGLFWGGCFKTIQGLIADDVVSEADIKFFVGYSGWGPRQLDRELKEKSWVVANTSIKEVMSNDPETFWKKNIQGSQKEYAIWADFPVNPSLN